MTEPIYERVLHDLNSHLPHHGYDQASTITSSTEEPFMSVLATFKADVEQLVADFIDKAAANPAVDAVLSAEHLSPEYLHAVADMVTKADADIAALKATAAVPAPVEPVAAVDVPGVRAEQPAEAPAA